MSAIQPRFAGLDPACLWVDPVNMGDPKMRPVILRYPDGSTERGRVALVCGLSQLVYRPTGYPDGKHVALETFADVHVGDDFGDLAELAFAAQRLQYAVGQACDRLELAGAVADAGELREAATLAGFPPSDRNPLAP